MFKIASKTILKFFATIVCFDIYFSPWAKKMKMKITNLIFQFYETTLVYGHFCVINAISIVSVGSVTQAEQSPLCKLVLLYILLHQLSTQLYIS